MIAGTSIETNKHTFDKFPIYNCDLCENGTIVCAGGDPSQAAFMGIPIWELSI